MNPLFLTDMYKTGHHLQYPADTSLIFSNFTPRKSRIPGVNHSVWFGLQYFLKQYLRDYFDVVFFDKPNRLSQDRAISAANEYLHVIDSALGYFPYPYHIENLH